MPDLIAKLQSWPVMLLAAVLLLCCQALALLASGLGLSMQGPEVALASMHPVLAYGFAVVIGPIWETAICQALPMELMRALGQGNAGISIGISAAVFGGAHLVYSPAYAACAFVAGLVLATGYAARMRPGGRPWLWVCLVHAANNGWVLTTSGA